MKSDDEMDQLFVFIGACVLLSGAMRPDAAYLSGSDMNAAVDKSKRLLKIVKTGELE